MRSNGSPLLSPSRSFSSSCIGKKWKSNIVDKIRKNRFVLLAIALVFGAPLLIALAMNLAGWSPARTRNYGTLVQPPVDVSAVSVAVAGDGRLDWRDPQWHWTL